MNRSDEKCSLLLKVSMQPWLMEKLVRRSEGIRRSRSETARLIMERYFVELERADDESEFALV